MARVAWREPPQSVFARATLPIGPSDACRRSSPSPSSPPVRSHPIIRRGRAALTCASVPPRCVCGRARVCVCVHVYVCSLCRVGGRGTRVPRCRLRESNLIVCVRRESLPRVTCSVTRKMRRSSGNAFWGSSRRSGNGQPASHRSGESSIVLFLSIVFCCTTVPFIEIVVVIFFSIDIYVSSYFKNGYSKISFNFLGIF